MSSKPKKGSKKGKAKNMLPNNTLPFETSTINNRHGRQQNQEFAMASRNNPEMDGVYPPLQNFATRHHQLNRPHTANSRLPYYTGNGTPLGYTPPYEGYNTPHPYVPLEYNCHVPPQQSHYPFPTHFGNQYYGQPYRTHRSTPSPNLVPYDVKLQQAFHRCQMGGSSPYSHRSAPVSARTTPSNSIPGTPHDITRRKDMSFYKSSCSTPTPSKLSRQPSLQTSSSASISSKSRKFESYLPLCEVQKAMKKGEVIEGVLRINPRNYEDAYISAPDGEMDIYIGGIVDRNRSLNGDRVAVRINPMSEWRILFDTIRLHWNEWSEHLLKCVNKPNTSRNSHINSIDIPANTANLASIPENPCITGVPNGFSPITAQAKQTAVATPEAVNRSTKLQSQSQKPRTESDLVSKLLPQSFKFTNVASQDSVVCDSPSETIVYSQCKTSKKKNRKRKRKAKKSELIQKDVTNPSMEATESDSVRSFDEFDDSTDVSQQKQILNITGKAQCGIVNEVQIFHDMCCIRADGSNDVAECQDGLLEDNCKLIEVEKNHEEPSNSSKFVPLEELIDDQWIDMNSSEEGCSDVGSSMVMEEVAFIEDESLENSKLLNTSNVGENGAQDLEEKHSEFVVDDKQSLDDMIKKLNAMAVISRDANNTTKNKGKKKKKPKFSVSEVKKVTIVTEPRNAKTPTRPKVKNTFGLPDAVLSINVLDVLKLPFGAQCVQKTGKVVYIYEKNHPRVAGGKLKLAADRNRNFALFSPIDSKVPRMMIDMDQCPRDFFQHPEHYSQTLFLAKIEEWFDSSTFPKGKLVKTLGEVGDINAETELILIENSIDDTEHGESSCIEFEALLDKNGEFKIPAKEVNSRRSFKSECVFTIDPSTARDLDDALSVKTLDEKSPDGKQLYEIGVHIADVTYFLESGSMCDMTARDRTTSVYLVQKVIPMLPRILCEKLCSLNAGEEKLTFSVVWKMDIEGNAYEEWFGRTVIESCAKLSYELAQDMIDNPQKEWSSDSLPAIYGNWSASDISNRVNILMTIARSLRKRRFDGGALNIDAMKFSFVLDPENGLPIGFTPESRRESNFLVEEFMLAANMAVAYRIYRNFPELSFLRCHPPPDSKLLKEFQEFCENANLNVDTTSPEAFKLSVTKLVSGNNLNSKVISYYFLRSLTMAMYFCSGMSSSKDAFKHYALNVPLYTHFTSPIRRYADVIVHRLLSAALNYTPQINDDAQDLHRLAKRCNDMKMAAANASEQSSKLFVNLYLKSVGSVVEKGIVSQVLDHAFDVIIPQLGHMARVYIESLDLKSFQYRSQGKKQYLELVWKNVDETKAHQVISAFSTVSLRISVSEKDLTKWNVTLLPNK